VKLPSNKLLLRVCARAHIYMKVQCCVIGRGGGKGWRGGVGAPVAALARLAVSVPVLVLARLVALTSALFASQLCDRHRNGGNDLIFGGQGGEGGEG